MKKTAQTLLLLVSLTATASFAAETSVKGTIYSTWMLNNTAGAGRYNTFTIDRAYLGAESKLSEYTNMRITFDIRPERFLTSATSVVDNEGDTVKIPSLSAYSGFPIILKYAYADFKIKPIAQYLKIRFGLQPTGYLNYLETTWGRRYIEKMVIDWQGWLSTSDFGVSAIASLDKLGNAGEVGVSLLNGTKYSDITEKNNNKDINLFGKLTPFYNSGDFNQTAFFAQFYTGTQNRTLADTDNASDWKNQIVSAGGKLAYRKSADICFDLNFHTLGQGAVKNDLKQSGLSFFGDLYLGELIPSAKALRTLVPFGRIDFADPNTDVADDGSTLAIVGIECAPVKGVRAAVDYRNKNYQPAGVPTEKYFFVNTEFKF